MMVITFGMVTLISAVVAAFSNRIRRAGIALWLAGMGSGGLFLALGAEYLGVLQWLVTTITAIGFGLFSVLFGDFPSQKNLGGSFRNKILIGLAGFLGVAFCAGVLYATQSLGLDIPWRGEAGQFGLVSAFNQGSLEDLGKKITETHFLSVELLGILLSIALLGAGLIARPEPREIAGRWQSDNEEGR